MTRVSKSERLLLSTVTCDGPRFILFHFCKPDVDRVDFAETLVSRGRARALYARPFSPITFLPRLSLPAQVFRDGDKCRLFYAGGSGRPGEVENDYESSEENGLPLRELALGLKRSIDAQTYVGGLRGKLIKVGAAEARRQPTTGRLAKLLRQRASENVEYEWYKQCMRKRIVPPYFRYIDDSYYPLPPRDPADEVASVSKNHSLVAANGNDELP